MRNTATLMLLAAVLIGGLTVWLARDFLESRPQQILTSSNDSAIEATTVVVAARPLAFGDTLSHEVLKIVNWPSDNVPEGSFTDINEILDGTERRVSLRAMEPNELILRSRVSGFGGRATLSQVINEGMRATTIRVNDVNGVAGFVLPGDHVDIMLTRQRGKNNREDMITDVIIQNIRVLAVDQSANENAEEPVVVKATTVEVSPEQAQKLSLAASVGTLTLALRNITLGEDEPTKLKTIRVSDLTPGLLEKKPTAKPTTKRRSTGSSSSSVRVYRGMKSNTKTVKKEKAPIYRAPQPLPTTSSEPSSTGSMSQEEMDDALSTKADEADGEPMTIVTTSN